MAGKSKPPFPPPIYTDGRKIMWQGGNGVTFRQNKVLIAQVRQTDHSNEAEDMAQALAHRYNVHDQLVAALREAEWVEFNDSDHGQQLFCNECRNDKKRGHYEGCSIAAALDAAEGKHQ